MFGLQWNADDRLIGQLLRWLVPWSPIHNSALRSALTLIADV
jgi:hypothetical protein